MKESLSVVSAKALRVPAMIERLRWAFTHALDGEPTQYRWHFVPKGDVVFVQDNGAEVLAEWDTVEIRAYL